MNETENDVRLLRAQAKAAKEKAEAARQRLEAAERACQHDWTESVYDPIHHKGYYDPGDPPGTMGVDRRLPSQVPPSVEDQWRRECRKCGKVQVTKSFGIERAEKKIPRF